MKVKCIAIGSHPELTVNKIYEVKRVTRYSYLVENDEGEMRLYVKDRFEGVKEDDRAFD